MAVCLTAEFSVRTNRKGVMLQRLPCGLRQGASIMLLLDDELEAIEYINDNCGEIRRAEVLPGRMELLSPFANEHDPDDTADANNRVKMFLRMTPLPNEPPPETSHSMFEGT